MTIAHIQASLLRFIDFITFVNLSIRKKFLLFGLGVLFWFAAMFGVVVVSVHQIEKEAAMVIDRIIPQERHAQEIVGLLQGILIEALEIQAAQDAAEVVRRVEATARRLGQVERRLALLQADPQAGARKAPWVAFSFFATAIADASDEEEFLTGIANAYTDAVRLFSEFSAGKAAFLAGQQQAPMPLAELKGTIEHGITAATLYAGAVAKLYAERSSAISTSLHLAILSGAMVLTIACALLGLFTYWISRSIARPVGAISNQIELLARGEVDLSKTVSVTSKDEVGVLAARFNGLMESIHAINTYKKVIEEDHNLDEVYARLGAAIATRHGISEYIIYEVSNSKNKLRPVQPLLLGEEALPCNPEILENCDLCKAKKTGHIISSFSFPGVCRQFAAVGMKHVCMPMIIGGSTGGIVQFRATEDAGAGEIAKIEQAIFRASQYVRESASVIEAKRLTESLRDSSLRDALTGLNNRRFLQEYTETIVGGAIRRGKMVGLIMCDLDFFKQVNDLYGHAAGDQILKEAAHSIRRTVRDADIVIRFGGEEFLVVLLDINEHEVYPVAEKIRASVEETKFKVHGKLITKTISLGISVFPNDTESFWQAIKFADVALYKAKEGGRNRSIRFHPDMWKEHQF